MSKNAVKSDGKKADRSSPKRDYVPRQGSLPGRIFEWLNERPRSFAELSDSARRETNLEGDKLASQLSAALYDLCSRGVVLRIDPATRRVISKKNARGALYGLEGRARAALRGGANGSAAQAPELRLPAGAAAVTQTQRLARPDRMPVVVFDALMGRRASAEKELHAIDLLFSSWN